MIPTMAREDMNYWRLEPDERLRRWIICYWMVEPRAGRAEPTTPPDDSHQLLLPDGHSELVFQLAGSFTRWRLDEPGPRKQMRTSYLIGGRAHSVLTHSPGGLRLAGVKLDPCALRALIGVPLAEFRDDTISLADLGCGALTDLEDAVANVDSPEALVALFDRFFLRRLAREVADESAVQSLVQRIRVRRGSQSILQWARDNAIDLRTLERRFLAAMGMTPKQFARVVRFKHSYFLMTTTRPPDARKAHLDAYYDESHFGREFRHFLGTTPVRWMADNARHRTTIGDHLLETEFTAR
jgi:AraC-like DNA-binding protein